jgi:hypothetical protein
MVNISIFRKSRKNNKIARENKVRKIFLKKNNTNNIEISFFIKLILNYMFLISLILQSRIGTFFTHSIRIIIIILFFLL